MGSFTYALLILAAQGAFLQQRSTTSVSAKLSEKLAARAAGIDQVIGVLKEMLDNFNTQMTEDKHNWEEYSKWSGDEETDRNSFIQEQEGLVMSSTAQLNANKGQVQTLTKQIADLASEIAETETSIAELVHLRQEEHHAHEEEITDLTHTIEAVNKATEVLEGHYAAGASMSQIKSEVTKALSELALSRASDPKMQTVTAFLQNPDWLAVDGGDQYGSYEGVAAQSGGVVGTLKSIRSTLQDNKQSSIEKENESRRQYESAKAAKESDLRRSNEEKTTKENTLEECNAKIEHFTAVISQATADIADAKSYVEHLLADRKLFSEEYDARVATRNQEQAATQAALDALQEVTAGAPSLSFVQVDATANTMALGVKCDHCSHAVQKLLSVGATTHSEALVQLGTMMQSSLRGTTKQPQGYFDPKAMEPIRNLLRELISKLEDELSAETSHHEWCQTEKETSAAAKAEREHNIESLTAEIDELTTKIAQLTTEIAFLASELIRVQQETETAVRIRKEEKETFETAKHDHDVVIEALDKAMGALSGQYGLFVQTGVKKSGIKTPFNEYSSGNAGGASAMEMLQDLLNRYSAARTQLIQAEETAVAAHEDLLARNEQFRKDTTQTKQAKETEKRQAEERLTNARAELAANRQELAEVVQYQADLVPSCDDIRSTFEERKKRREAEIAALKETLAVLEDPSMMR